MGKKAVMIMGLVQALAQIVILIGLMLPFHKMSFFAAFLVRVARMTTHILWVHIPKDSSDFCELLKMLKVGKPKWCKGWGGDHDLQEVGHRMCAPGLHHLWPAMCQGLSSAFVIGWALVIIAGINFILQVAAGFLLFDYAYRKANPSYRMFALSFSCIGTFCMFSVLAMYYVFVIIELDNVYGGGSATIVSIVLSASRGFGMAEGYILVCFGTFIQLVSLTLFIFSHSDEREEDYEEYQANKEYAKMRAQENKMYGSCPGPQPMPATCPSPVPMMMAPVQMGPPAPMVIMAEGPVVNPGPMVAMQVPAEATFGMAPPGGTGMAFSAGPAMAVGPPTGPLPPDELARRQQPVGNGPQPPAF